MYRLRREPLREKLLRKGSAHQVTNVVTAKHSKLTPSERPCWSLILIVVSSSLQRVKLALYHFSTLIAWFIVASSFIIDSSSLAHRWENFWLFKLLLLMDASAYVKHRCSTTKHPQLFTFLANKLLLPKKRCIGFEKKVLIGSICFTFTHTQKHVSYKINLLLTTIKKRWSLELLFRVKVKYIEPINTLFWDA